MKPEPKSKPGSGPARTHSRTRGAGPARARLPVATVGAEAQGEVACRGSPGSRRRRGRGRMAEGGQPQQQPPQLGPGAAARGMKRESELELPVPGAGADGPEPGLSKRPRTEEAADGGMQVTARDGAGLRRAAAGSGLGAPGGPGWRVGLGPGAGAGLLRGRGGSAREWDFLFGVEELTGSGCSPFRELVLSSLRSWGILGLVVQGDQLGRVESEGIWWESSREGGGAFFFPWAHTGIRKGERHVEDRWKS